MYVSVAVRRIGYPYELSYFEGSTVEVTARVVLGHPLYGPPTTDFTPWPYPPLYFWLTAGMARLTGLNITSLRLVSFAASLAVLVLIASIVRRTSGSFPAGVVAAGLYAASYRVSGAWADTARVDSLLLALLLASVMAGLIARRISGGVFFGVLIFLAFLTKQTAVLVAAPMLTWLLIHRPRVGIPAAATSILLGAGSVVVGDLLTRGWYSPYVVTQLLHQRVAARWLWEFWLVDLVLPFAIAFAVGFGLWRRFRPARPDRAFGWIGGNVGYLAASVAGLLLAALIGRLHDGGYANVAMPAHAGLAIGFGLILAMALNRRAGSTRLIPTVGLALAIQFLAMTFWHLHVEPTEADRIAGDSFIARLRVLPGAVLIPSHPYYLRLAGLPTHASSLAIGDILNSAGGRNREAMTAEIPWSLTGVAAVILDKPSATDLFGPELTREFTLITSAVVPDGDFLPVTDLPTRPSLLFVRTTALDNP